MFLTIPGPVNRNEVPMSFRGEPQHDEAVEQHRHRGGALDPSGQKTVRREKAAIFSGCNSHPVTGRFSR